MQIARSQTVQKDFFNSSSFNSSYNPSLGRVYITVKNKWYHNFHPIAFKVDSMVPFATGACQYYQPIHLVQNVRWLLTTLEVFQQLFGVTGSNTHGCVVDTMLYLTICWLDLNLGVETAKNTNVHRFHSNLVHFWTSYNSHYMVLLLT